jgi:1-acyl-sn-glycerol-3-phosphate acyltransferase
MGSVRSILFNGLWGVWTALIGVTIPFLLLAGSPPRIVRSLTRIWARGILAMLSWIVGLTYEVRGRENMPSSPSLVICNHESTWETLAALVLFPEVAIVAKQELLRIPVMGWFLQRSPMILIDREDSRKALRAMVDESKAALANGRSVLIFPEGTRKRADEPIEFKRGFEMLYRTLGVAVLPVVVNSGRFWGIDDSPKRSGMITVSFLAPIKPGMSAKDFIATTETLMETERRALA